MEKILGKKTAMNHLKKAIELNNKIKIKVRNEDDIDSINHLLLGGWLFYLLSYFYYSL